MEEHRTDYHHWILTEPGVLARGRDRVDGLFIIGEVSGHRLREVSLAKLDLIDWSSLVAFTTKRASRRGLIPADEVRVPFPVWWQPHPPSEADTKVQEHRLSKDGFHAFLYRWVIEHNADTLNQGDSSDLTSSIRALLDESVGQDRDEYYRRFAITLTGLAAITRSPSQTMAEALQLSPNTIKQYAHRARTLGYLPESRKGAPG